MKKLNDDIAFWHWARARQAKSGVSWSSYWTQQYQDVLDFQITNGAEPNNYDKLRQARFMKKIVEEGYFDKAELIDMFATNKGGGLVNWKYPGIRNPSIVNNPTHEPYSGYRGRYYSNVAHAINLNVTPSTDFTIAKQNNICVIMGIGSDVMESVDDFGSMGAADLGRLSMRAIHSNGNAYYRCNSATANAKANSLIVGYYGMSRNSSSVYDSYINKTKTQMTANTNGLSDKALHACGVNTNGIISNNQKLVRFVWISSYLTESEYLRLIDIFEEYLADYHANLIDYDTYLFKSYRTDKINIPLVTYDGGGETIHPSVVDCGAEWNGYRYWMINMPYPNSNYAYENPSIWASADGVSFSVPTGGTNPIYGPPPNGGVNADCGIVFESNKLYAYWKRVDPNPEIVMSETSDGVTWSTPKVISQALSGETEQVSPTIIKVGARFYMYYGKYLTTGSNLYRIRRRSCNTIDGLYTGMEELIYPEFDSMIYWHHGVIYYGGYYYLIAMNSSGSTQAGQCYILRSSDGVNFVRSPFAALDVSDQSFDYFGYYRPFLATIAGQPYVFYTGRSNANKWTCNRMKIDLL